MKKYISCSDAEVDSVLKYMPPSTEINYYLDTADGIPACYPKVVYNGTEFDFTDHLKNIGIVESFRDMNREQAALKAAMKYFYIPEPENKRLICDIFDSDIIYELLTNGLDELMMYGMVQMAENS